MKELRSVETLYGIEVPQHLCALTERHTQHLAELIAMLRTVGMDETAIEEAVDQLIADYRVQLLDAVRASRAVS